MKLPSDFCTLMQQQLGEQEFQLFLSALENEPVCSIRINSRKPSSIYADSHKVPWCQSGRYLSSRPQFTLDPLFHAGCYYVQEASSMFLSHLIHKYVTSGTPLTCLDLCAAPGGKSTLLLNDLPSGSRLFANEPIRQRANILKENIIKWGNPNVVVTNNYPADYQPLGAVFDLILCDAPCSGEGMFRKDADSINEWSLDNVYYCQNRQREIISDIWDSLRDGGLFIYSTCTYNHFEDEDNVQWIADTFGAEILPLCDQPEWGITDGHFYPHHTHGEGFFVSIFRKHGNTPAKHLDERRMLKSLRILLNGTDQGRVVDKKGTVEPSHSMALATTTDTSQWPHISLSLVDALQYLRGEILHLPEGTPKGYVLLYYGDYPLGFCKNIGTRANNLYPNEWRIKKK